MGPRAATSFMKEENFMEKLERVDVLVKGVPVRLHNIFKGLCAMSDKTLDEGIIEAMAASIEKTNGGKNEGLKEIMDRYRQATKKK
jgi:hypothetical protein